MRRISLALVAPLLVLAAACDPKVYGTATLDGDALDLVDVRGTVTTDGTEIVYRLSGWSNPSCSIADDEDSVRIELRVADVAAVPLATPIDVADPDAPVKLSLSMGAMGGWCMESDCVDPVFALAGTVTLQALSADAARGAVDVTLSGDVPFTDQTDRIFKRDAVLHVAWSGWKIPDDVDHCD
jgi:hypothetical protein